MSRENVEIVRRAIDAFSRAHLEGVLETLAPDCEFRPSGRFMDTKPVYYGRDGWIDFWNTFLAAWESIPVSIERITDLGERVLTLATFHGRGRGSGVEASGEVGWIHTVEDGLVTELQAFSSWDQALQAAGLSE